MKLPWIRKRTLKHSSKGDFEYKNRKPVKMNGGGHGQENIEYLAKNKVGYSVNIQYNNGVRLGNVSIHRRDKCRNRNGQCWFPEHWTKKDFEDAANYVYSLKKNQGKNSQTPMVGTYKGVKLGIYVNNGKVTSIFPWYTQNK